MEPFSTDMNEPSRTPGRWMSRSRCIRSCQKPPVHFTASSGRSPGILACVGELAGGEADAAAWASGMPGQGKSRNHSAAQHQQVRSLFVFVISRSPQLEAPGSERAVAERQDQVLFCIGPRVNFKVTSSVLDVNHPQDAHKYCHRQGVSPSSFCGFLRFISSGEDQQPRGAPPRRRDSTRDRHRLRSLLVVASAWCYDTESRPSAR